MAKKIVPVIVILIIILIAYQYIKVSIENSTLDRNLFAVLTMHKKRFETGGSMSKIEDLRRDAHLEFREMNIPMNPKDIQVEVNWDDDYIGIRAKYKRELSFILYKQTKIMNVDVKCELN